MAVPGAGAPVQHEPAGARASILMLLALPEAVLPKAAPRPAPKAATTPQQRPTAATGGAAAAAATAASIIPAPATDEPAPTDSAPALATTNAPDPFAISQPRTAATIIAQAKRDLPRIDKEILGKTKGVPDDRPETLEERLARGIAGAYVGGDTAETTHHYTSADGVVYTRITRGPHTECYRSRIADFNSVFGSIKTRVKVKCPPANSGWTR